MQARFSNAIDTGGAENRGATFVPESGFNTLAEHDALVQIIHDWCDKMGRATRRHQNTNLTIAPTPEGANSSVCLMLANAGVRPTDRRSLLLRAR